MAEEFRVFIRVGLFAAVVGAVYWFVSYEEAGSILLVATFLASAVFVVVGIRLAGSLPRSRRGPVGAVRDAVGFDDPADRVAPLTAEDEPFAEASVWPVLLAVAALLLGGGLLFGAWLWVPGAGLAFGSAWGWVGELEG